MQLPANDGKTYPQTQNSGLQEYLGRNRTTWYLEAWSWEKEHLCQQKENLLTGRPSNGVEKQRVGIEKNGNWFGRHSEDANNGRGEKVFPGKTGLKKDFRMEVEWKWNGNGVEVEWKWNGSGMKVEWK